MGNVVPAAEAEGAPYHAIGFTLSIACCRLSPCLDGPMIFLSQSIVTSLSTAVGDQFVSCSSETPRHREAVTSFASVASLTAGPGSRWKSATVNVIATAAAGTFSLSTMGFARNCVAVSSADALAISPPSLAV